MVYIFIMDDILFNIGEKYGACKSNPLVFVAFCGCVEANRVDTNDYRADFGHYFIIRVDDCRSRAYYDGYWRCDRYSNSHPRFSADDTKYILTGPV